MKITKVAIPATIEEAQASLQGIGALLTAKSWERAAIVAAFVEIAERDGGRKPVSSNRLSPNEFAALGITGLKSHVTVRGYVERWTAVRPAPKPGEIVELEGLPEWATPSPGSKSKAEDIATQPGAVRQALEDPTFRAKVITPEVVAKVVAEDKTAARAVAKSDASMGAVDRAQVQISREELGDRPEPKPYGGDKPSMPELDFMKLRMQMQILMEMHPDRRQAWADSLTTLVMEIQMMAAEDAEDDAADAADVAAESLGGRRARWLAGETE